MLKSAREHFANDSKVIEHDLSQSVCNLVITESSNDTPYKASIELQEFIDGQSFVLVIFILTCK
jgi:hypothetical protein